MGSVGWYIAGAVCGIGSCAVALFLGAFMATGAGDCCPHREAERTPKL